MKKIFLASALLCASLIAQSDTTNFVSDGEAFGNIKYFYIETDKQGISNKANSSAHANSIGGQLGYKTSKLYGFYAKVTFMTTNGFALPNVVDTSILGRDNGVRLEGSAGGEIAQQSFSVLGEAVITYTGKSYDINYGRQVIKTPLIHAKEVRMLPSAVQGSVFNYDNKDFGLDISLSYLTDFKQRTSNVFTNIVEHALGTNTQAIIGHAGADVVVSELGWNMDGFKIEATNYYAQDFMNSFYGVIGYKRTTQKGFQYNLMAEGIIQRSVGNADENLQEVGSVTGAKRISADSLSLKGDFAHFESKITMAYSLVRAKEGTHDSLVLPWDGTPLYTNNMTSNVLFSSNYGQAFKADSIYIGGTQSYKLAYVQGYDFSGIEGFKTTLSYVVGDNEAFDLGYIHDLNAVVKYTKDNYSIAFKGIFVKHAASADEAGNISQIDAFQQYRVIANYKF